MLFAALSLLVGCAPSSTPRQDVATTTEPPDGTVETDPTEPSVVEDPPPPLYVTDEAASSGYQDRWFTGYKRGRGNVVADFDGDGDLDVFSGNPGNESFLIRNVTPPGGALAFEPWQVLSYDELFYGGVAADFDNDGDIDLFVSAGANDGNADDRLFRNDYRQGAPDDAPLVDISTTVKLGPQDEQGTPWPNGTMGVRAFDADGDGRLDVWADNYARDSEIELKDPIGRNQLYLNGGELLFEDQAAALEIDVRSGTRHSSIFDFDRDGDADIFENNYHGASILWRNLRVETGSLGFQDVTMAMSFNYELSDPVENQAMCSLVADLDNDGWEDLVVLNRGLPYTDLRRHLIFMNQDGERFVEVGLHSNLNAGFDLFTPFEGKSPMDIGWGVMGCQTGDANLDGFPDFFIGTGSGASGDVNRLFVSSERIAVPITGIGDVDVPLFDDWTSHIDFAPVSAEGNPLPYPLRTHGTSFADFDGDGVPELSVHNGGPAISDDTEPNRLFKFHHPDPRFLRVRLVGDGTRVSRDAIGARVRVRTLKLDGNVVQELYQVRQSATGFGAQNEPDLLFGLGSADRVTDIEVTWPDGLVVEVEPPDGPRNWISVER